MLLVNGQWLGTGKWLGRALDDADAAFAAQLAIAVRGAHAGTNDALLTVVATELDATGGPANTEWISAVEAPNPE
jgi:hypothetical protein